MALSIDNSGVAAIYNSRVVDYYISTNAKKICTSLFSTIKGDLESGSGFHNIIDKYTIKDLSEKLAILNESSKGVYEGLLKATIKCLDFNKQYWRLKDMTDAITQIEKTSGKPSQFLPSFVFQELDPLVKLLKLVDPNILNNTSSWSSMSWSVTN